MKTFALSLLAVLVSFPLAHADLSMPKKRNFYDQAGEGLANIIHAPSEILDSTYELSMNEGPTVGYTKGVVQGVSRTVMDIFVGVAQVVTSPFAQVIDSEMKLPAYDSQQAEAYPPADLLDNWY